MTISTPTAQHHGAGVSSRPSAGVPLLGVRSHAAIEFDWSWGTYLRISIAALLLLAALPLSAATCDTLASLHLPSTTITAEPHPAGSFTPPGARPIANLPAFCRVAGVIRPDTDSDIRFEVWLPADGWNGKFEGLGNGGYAGSIDYAAMAGMLTRGYAVASTDTGHRGGATDATWALGHPQRVTDFGYRAIHETTVQSKAIAAAFYGGAPKHAYFNGCSNGGRQALMEAQRYPADYDGIVAGAPANSWVGLLSSGMWQQTALQDPEHAIPPAKLPAIEAAVLAACDAQDGVKDGVVDNPPACRFDAAVLLCKGEDSAACLTAPQVSMLKMIHSGPKTAKGASIYPGYSVGGETGQSGWAAWIVPPAQGRALGFAFSTQFYSQMVFEKTDWDFHTFNVERDMKIAAGKLGATMDATDPSLKAFHDRGGKLIVYHGWSDAAIPPMNAVQYYEAVQSKMGKTANDFVRLFMIPGMQHCGGGPGPDVITAPADPQHDIRLTLERWVEEGKAPEQIIATKFKPGTAAIARTRPICAYPLVAKYTGTGSTDDAANFTCVKPDATKK